MLVYMVEFLIFYYWSLLSLSNKDTDDTLQQMENYFQCSEILIRPGYYRLYSIVVQGIYCGVFSHYLFDIVQIFSGNEILHWLKY